MNHEGAPKGNQNARQRGWTSKQNPAPVEDILSAADHAANTGDRETLRKAKRALEWRGLWAEAGTIGEVLALLEMEKRDAANNTLYAPERIANQYDALPVQPTATKRAAPIEERIAHGRRQSETWPDR